MSLHHRTPARRCLSAAALALALTAASALAADAPAALLAEGGAFPPVTAADAHERTVALPGTARLVLFAPDRAAANVVQAWLAGQPAERLPQAGAVYLADIARMPSLVTRMFALPALRELGHPVALVRDATAVADLPRREGQVTLLWLHAGRVQRLGWANDAAALTAALEAAAPTP